MQRQNLDEYKLLRNELSNLKSCVTTYVGFVLGGSGAALFVLGKATTQAIRDNDRVGLVGLATAGVAISFIITLVVSILLYKFNSHNRFAGYCKLIAQERLTCEQSDLAPLLAWEICMDNLRKSDLGEIDLVAMCNQCAVEAIPRKTLRDRVRAVTGPDWPADAKSGTVGWHSLGRVIAGRRIESDSWHFPVYILAVLLMLVVLLLVASCALFFMSGAWWLFCLVPVVYAQGTVWDRFASKLGCLMKGSATVDSNCWRFLPIRYLFVKEHLPGISTYALVGVDEGVRLQAAHDIGG